MRGIISKHGILRDDFHYIDIVEREKKEDLNKEDINKYDLNKEIFKRFVSENPRFLYDRDNKKLIDLADSVHEIQLRHDTDLLLKKLFSNRWGVSKREQYKCLAIKRKRPNPWNIMPCTNASQADRDFIKARIDKANGEQASRWDLGFTSQTRYRIANEITRLCARVLYYENLQTSVKTLETSVLPELKKLGTKALNEKLTTMQLKYSGVLKTAINFIFDRPTELE
jgi:hypothetical protein